MNKFCHFLLKYDVQTNDKSLVSFTCCLVQDLHLSSIKNLSLLEYPFVPSPILPCTVSAVR